MPAAGPYDDHMAYDEQLAERVRGVLASAGMTPTEKKMFGGLSFLIGGNMCCGVLGADLLARVGPDAASGALSEPATRPFDMGRGPSPGWVLISPGGTATDQGLTGWVQQHSRSPRRCPPSSSRRRPGLPGGGRSGAPGARCPAWPVRGAFSGGGRG